MRRRGIVMDLQSDFAVVLSSDGQFCRLPRTQEMAVGADVQWEASLVPAQGTQTRRRAWNQQRPVWQRVGIAGMAACMAIAAGTWWAVSSPNGTGRAEAYAFVSVDINPSVSMTVNKNMIVLDASGVNTDGIQLLHEVNVENETLDNALKDIVSTAAKEGMLPDEDAILISTAPVDGNTDVDDVRQQAQQAVEKVVETNPAASAHHPTVYAIGLSNQVFKAAQDAHVSPGKFAAYVIASKEGQKLNLGQLEGKTLGDVLSQSEAKSVVEALNTHNLDKVADLLNSLQQPDLPPIITVPNQSGDNPDKNKPDSSNHGNGHNDGPPQDHGKHGNKNTDDHPGNVTIQLGNSVITVPLGPWPGTMPSKDENNNVDGGSDSNSGASNKDRVYNGQTPEDTSQDGGSARNHDKSDRNETGDFKSKKHSQGDSQTESSDAHNERIDNTFWNEILTIIGHH